MRDLLARPGWRWLRRVLEAGTDLLFPLVCAGCGRPGSEWCSECDDRLARLRGRLCAQCGEPLAGRKQCPRCSERALPLVARSYAWYREPLVHAVLHLKYRPDRRLARRMAGWLEEICRRERWHVDVVVPVALSPRRQRQRGYNQAELVASALADLLEIPLASGGLVRTRETRSQVGLDANRRADNVRDAFRASAVLVGGRAVLLVDDLFTTGATLAACAEALWAAGAAQVFAVTVARA